jgi:hypothetical protein
MAEKTKLDYLIAYVEALATIRKEDGTLPLWVNEKIQMICDKIEKEIERL